MTYEAIAIFDNGHRLSWELEDYQVDEFVDAVYRKIVYKDDKTGVISWLPPDRLHHLIVKPNLESPKCQETIVPDDLKT